MARTGGAASRSSDKGLPCPHLLRSGFDPWSRRSVEGASGGGYSGGDARTLARCTRL